MTSTTFFFFFIPLLAIILLAVNLIFAPHNPYQEKDSVFECGFHSFLGQNRTQFSISFFIFALLFLLFDLEILLVYPYVVSAYTNGIYGLVIMLIFFLALTLGFAFELGKNALKIDSRQMLTLNNKPISKVSFMSALKSPLKSHAFVSLPLQSKISLSSMKKHLSLANILTGIGIFIAFFILRNYIFPEVYYITKISFLDGISFDFYINKDFFLGILAVIGRFSLKGLIEEVLEVFLPNKILAGDGQIPLFVKQDNISSGKGGSNQTPVINKEGQKIIDSILTESIRPEFDKFKSDMGKYAKRLEARQVLFDKGDLTMHDEGVSNMLILILQDQTQYFNASIMARLEWVQVTLPNLPGQVKDDLSIIKNDIFKLQGKHTDNIHKIASMDNEQQQVKAYFDLLNAYRNNVKKEIVNYETVWRDGFRNNTPELYKLKEFKQLVNVEGPKAIKEVVDQDGYLKSKMSIIINAKKS